MGTSIAPANDTATHDELSMKHYTVAYEFNNFHHEEDNPIPMITETVAKMEQNGIDIEFLGANLEIDDHGQIVAVTVRYTAQSKGTIGRLNCRTDLPASGPPQLTFRDETAIDSRPVPVAGG